MKFYNKLALGLFLFGFITILGVVTFQGGWIDALSLLGIVSVLAGFCVWLLHD